MQGTETVVVAGRIGPYKLRGELDTLWLPSVVELSGPVD